VSLKLGGRMLLKALVTKTRKIMTRGDVSASTCLATINASKGSLSSGNLHSIGHTLVTHQHYTAYIPRTPHNIAMQHTTQHNTPLYTAHTLAQEPHHVDKVARQLEQVVFQVTYQLR
jgi:hypothetical protein